MKTERVYTNPGLDSLINNLELQYTIFILTKNNKKPIPVTIKSTKFV
jgi:hypothetical protein